MTRLLIAAFFAVILIAQTSQANADMTGGIRGTVVDWNTHLPLVGAIVRVLAPERVMPTTTNARGEYFFSGVEPGRYTLRAEYDGYQADNSLVLVCVGATRSVDFYLMSHPGSIDHFFFDRVDIPQHTADVYEVTPSSDGIDYVMSRCN